MIKDKKRIGIIFAALAVLTLFSACGKKSTLPETEADMTPFQPPADFNWEGSYIDRVGDLAVLTIETANNGFLCTICVPDKEITHVEAYEFTALPADDGLGLSYTDGVRTSYLVPAEGKADQGVKADEIYTDGTGRLYYLDGSVFWLDEKDDAGTTLIFDKVEEEEAAAE